MAKRIVCAFIVAVSIAAIAWADTYRVTVKRVDQNLYLETTSKVVIETSLCLELALGDPAILKWEGRYGDNWIVFTNSGTKCDVKSVH